MLLNYDIITFTNDVIFECVLLHSFEFFLYLKFNFSTLIHPITINTLIAVPKKRKTSSFKRIKITSFVNHFNFNNRTNVKILSKLNIFNFLKI